MFQHETTNKKDDIKKQNIRTSLEIRKSAEVEDEQKNNLILF